MNSHSEAVTAKKNNLHRGKKYPQLTILFEMRRWHVCDTNGIIACMCVSYDFPSFPLTRNTLRLC